MSMWKHLGILMPASDLSCSGYWQLYIEGCVNPNLGSGQLTPWRFHSLRCPIEIDKCTCWTAGNGVRGKAQGMLEERLKQCQYVEQRGTCT